MLHIVIPVYNRKEFTKECLLSLRKTSFKKFKIIVVDDGSSDGTRDMLRFEFPEVVVLSTKGNQYWAATVNLGIKYAISKGATHILTLNNDTLATHEFLSNMMNWSKRKPDALIGALELDAFSKKACYGGEKIDWFTHTTTYLLDVLPDEDQKGLHEVSHYWGRGLLIPVHIIREIGMFREKVFPHYYADCDFTMLALKKGFKVYCNYDAPLYTFPAESGQNINRAKKNLRNYYNHLFSLKGGGNLRNFTLYTIRHCPMWCLPSHLLLGYVRRIGGYLIK
jgi:GT2 family glycosyltransferase